ncbi:phage protein [Serratia marcescens]|uniref:head-tail joining protein n=1 Tax=Serratia marcescens TaxID=615 RepID=UPI00062C2A09|nr:hypothetical protein [Serratia marcescens]KKZ18108.1 phage protein [Serratia marcescens]
MVCPIDWDKKLLAPNHNVFGQPVEYRPDKGLGTPFMINGIFDRAYTREIEPLDDDGPTLNTTRPVLGVRDSQFPTPPQQGDKLYIPLEKALFVVADVQPDSHGGTRLELNRVKGVP